MDQPMIMLNNGTVDGLAVAKKAQLAARIETAVEEEMCECCLEALNASAQGIEEFFNKCHDDGGRFCGGQGNGGVGGYVKQRVGNAKSVHQGRVKSAAVSRVTTGAVRRVLGLSTAYGSVKVNRLSKTKLNSFTDKDLHTVRRALQTDQRRYDLMHTLGWAGVASFTAQGAIAGAKKGSVGGPGGAAIGAGIGALVYGSQIGLANYKTKRIPGQIQRVERELTKRGQSFEAILFEFALEDYSKLPTLAEEIAQANKDIEAAIKSGNVPKAKVSAADEAELKKVISALSKGDEEGLTAAIIRDLQTSIK